MCIAIVCSPVCDVINFEIIIKLFSDQTVFSGKKCKYLQNENSFLGEIKPESGPLRITVNDSFEEKSMNKPS